MRYELFLTRLPRLDASEIAAQLGDLPDGLSTGVLTKALQSGQLPLIAVGWGENRADMAKIRERLSMLGGDSHIKDHAFFLVRLWSALGQLGDAALAVVGLGGTQEAPARSRRVASIPGGEQGASQAGAFTGAAMEIAAGVLLYTSYALTLGDARTPEALLPRLAVVAFGVGCARTLQLGVAAALAHRIGLLAAAPTVIVPLSAFMFAVLNLQAHPHAPARPAPLAKVETAPRAALPPPPSRPYQGLIEELRIRKLRALEQALQDLRGSVALARSAAVTELDRPAQQVREQTPTATVPQAAPRAPAVNAKEPRPGLVHRLGDLRLWAAAIATWLALLGMLSYWLSARTRRARREALELQQRHDARVAGVLAEVQALQQRVAEDQAARAMLERSLSEEMAAKEAAEGDLSEQAGQHADVRAAFERELAALRGELERTLQASTRHTPKAMPRAGARFDPLPPLRSSPPRAGLSIPGPTDATVASFAPPAEYAANPAPVASAPPLARRPPGQRSSYAVHDAGEERVSLPKDDKR